MKPFAVVRMKTTDDAKYNYAISSEDLYLTMASTRQDALTQVKQIGWTISSTSHETAMTLANPNHGTLEYPVYSRPVYVDSSIESTTKYLETDPDYTPEYIATEVTTIGTSTKSSYAYILAWGGYMTPFIPPRVVCCYATSYPSMIATLAMIDDPVVMDLMDEIGMTYRPSDMLVLDIDPFTYPDVISKPVMSIENTECDYALVDVD
jgi:hypothetical protein